MAFINPIQRATLPDWNEASRQRVYTGRESDSVGRVWRKSRGQKSAEYGTRQGLAQVQRQLNRLRRNRSSGDDSAFVNYHPFKIYLSPRDPRPDPTGGPEQAWRTFRVRNGLVNLQQVIHTDAVEYPWGGEVPEFNGALGDPNDTTPVDPTDPFACDFLVPENEAHVYAWVDLTGAVLYGGNGIPSYSVFIHKDPPNSVLNPVNGLMESDWTWQRGWDDGQYVLLGWIDTKTKQTDKVALVRQLVDEDLILNLVASMYRLKSVQGDYVTCRAWNGIAQIGPDVYIAKQLKIRHSINQEKIEGVDFYYTYPVDDVPWVGPTLGGAYGKASDGSYYSRYRKAFSDPGRQALVEVQVVTPEWLANDFIYAVPCATDVPVTVDGVVKQIGLLMLSDGRAWTLHHE